MYYIICCATNIFIINDHYFKNDAIRTVRKYIHNSA